MDTHSNSLEIAEAWWAKETKSLTELGFGARGLTHWPMPMAQAIAGILEEPEGSWFRRVHRLIDATEVIIKYVAVISIADVLNDPVLSEPLRELFLSSLQQPSLGHWVRYTELAVEALQSRERELFVPDLIPYRYQVLSKKVHPLTALRNTYAHGATPDESRCAEDFRDIFPLFFEFLKNSAFLSSCGLVVVYQGTTSLAIDLELIPSQLSPPNAKGDQVWLHRNEAWLCLSPLISYQPCPMKRQSNFACGLRKFLFYNDQKKENFVTYLDYRNSHVGRLYNDSEAYQNFCEKFPLKTWRDSAQYDPFTLVIEEKTEHFVGRNQELKELEDWVTSKSKGYLLIEGSPGVGKSALLASLTKMDLPNVQTIWHFIRRQDGPTPEKFLRSVISSLAARFSVHNATGNREEMLVQLKENLWDIGKELSIAGKKLLLIIDGLDEALAAETETSIANTILDYIPWELPNGILVLLSGRPRTEIFDFYVNILNSEYKRKMAMAGLDDNNIRAMLYKVTSKYELTPETVRCIERASAGNPLYMKRLTEEIIEGERDVNDVKTLPKGVIGFHEKDFQRLRLISDDLVTLLMLLAHAREPLTVEQLCNLSGLSSNSTNMLKDKMLDVLTLGERSEEQTLSLYHDSFADYLKQAHGYESNTQAVYARYIQYASRKVFGSTLEPYILDLIESLVAGKLDDGVDVTTFVKIMEATDAEGMSTARYILLQCLSQIPPEILLKTLRKLFAKAITTETLIVEASLSAFARIEQTDKRESLIRKHIRDLLEISKSNFEESVGQCSVRIAVEIALNLTEHQALLPLVGEAVYSACTHSRKELRVLGVLGLLRLKRMGDTGYKTSLTVLEQLMDKVILLGFPLPGPTETAITAAMGLFLEDSINRNLQVDLRRLSAITINRIVLLKPALWLLPKIAERIISSVPSDSNAANIEEMRVLKKLLASNETARRLVTEMVNYADPSYKDDESFRSAWKEYNRELAELKAGMLYLPLTIAFVNRALAGNEAVLEDVYECFRDIRKSQSFLSYDIGYRIQMIQLGRKLRSQGPLPDIWSERMEEVLEESFIKGFRPFGCHGYLGGFGGPINVLVRHTGKTDHPIIEKLIHSSLEQQQDNVSRVWQRDMILARELEINAIEKGTYDYLARGWTLHGLSCFLKRRTQLDKVLFQKLAEIGKKMFLYFPVEFGEMLSNLEKPIAEEFLTKVKSTKVEMNLGELVSTRTDTFLAMLYSEPISLEGGMRSRLMELLRSLFSPDPLEETLKIFIEMIMFELQT